MLYLLFANFFFKSFHQKTLREYIDEYKKDKELYSQFLSNIYLKYFFLEQENSELASLLKEELSLEVGSEFFEKKSTTNYFFYPIESEEQALLFGASYERLNKTKAYAFYKNYLSLQPFSNKILEKIINITENKDDFSFYIKVLLSRGVDESKLELSKELALNGYCSIAIEEFERSLDPKSEEFKRDCLKKLKIF